MVQEKLITLLAEHLGINPAAITAETTFESLGIDSLDTVEMIMELEEQLGVELELDEKVATIGELVAFIERKIG
ncbi:MAG: acyl carrier protein [Oscillospiraceae bacterium]|nr:acyl carrier protein [Oscillospiraceae bacterium]